MTSVSRPSFTVTTSRQRERAPDTRHHMQDEQPEGLSVGHFESHTNVGDGPITGVCRRPDPPSTFGAGFRLCSRRQDLKGASNARGGLARLRAKTRRSFGRQPAAERLHRNRTAIPRRSQCCVAAAEHARRLTLAGTSRYARPCGVRRDDAGARSPAGAGARDVRDLGEGGELHHAATTL